MPEDPKFIGVPPGIDPVVAKYKETVAARAKAEGDKRRISIPNLAEAQAGYDPKKDAPMTLGQIGQARSNMDEAIAAGEEPPRTLSDGSVQGLQALYAASADQKGSAVSTHEETEVIPLGEAETEEAEIQKKARVTDAISQTDDLDLDLLMQRMRQDLINNDEQRKIIEERVTPMNLGDGIATGEFSQVVPIKPDQLEVKYRTVSPMEVEHLRRMVLEMELQDERLANMTVDRFSLMQMVASVVMINGKALPTHIKNPGAINAEFLEGPFLQKYAVISNYPGPFIHALSTHSYWFDLRVRTLFTMDNLKNG